MSAYILNDDGSAVIGTGMSGTWLDLSDDDPRVVAWLAGAESLARRGVILTRLTVIDAESIRPAREIAAALAAGQPAPVFSVSKLAALETEAEALRTELRGLPT